MKKLTRLGGIVIGIGAGIAGVLWLIKDRIVGTTPQTVDTEDAPAFRVSPSAPVSAENLEDDLSVIKGIGPVYRARLAAEGITSYAGLAAADAAGIAESIEVTEARIAEWIDQAGQLASN